MTIVVTGATGTVGRLVVRQLVDSGRKVRAVTRGGAPFPTPIEVVRADLDTPESLTSAFTGAEALLLLCRPATALDVARLAERCGVRRIVTLSSIRAEGERDAPYHLAVERAVESVDVAWTHLRPGMFAANLLGWAEAIRGTGVVREPYSAAAQTPIHEADIAAVAVAALSHDGHAGRKYPLSGPQTLDKPEQLAAIGAGIGRALRFEEISPDDWRARADSLPGFVQDLLLEIWTGSAATPEPVLPTVAEVTGRPARTLAEWAADHAADFGGDPR
ncbi:NAD-dependent epimerase/dehydratase family protein [Nocardia panacis]|uniref:NAD-dependent epimerase/dehydratase family protein n=1 Tax=Nocardia panacis TaxID=2340916 RepID=A0A3A4K1V1_9NOCA|nr:NAD(P)H-binding protein [Nocardia panacis]RJO78418.1 NAD-dependent epimerase/dehydratase family protein [Nocardia panacis]